MFSSTQGAFTNIDPIMGHKIYLNKFKRIRAIQSRFSEIKLEIKLIQSK